MVDIPSQQAVMTSETQFPSKIFEKINMTAEHLGRISYGVMALGLAML